MSEDTQRPSQGETQPEISAELARRVHELSPMPVLSVAADGTFRYANAAACRLLGYSRAELESMNVVELDNQLPDHESWQAAWEMFCRKGTHCMETAAKCRDGTSVPIEITGNQLEDDAGAHLLVFMRDLTEHHELVAQHEQRNKTLEAVLDCMTDAVFAIDSNCEYILVNRVAEKLLPAEIRKLALREQARRLQLKCIGASETLPACDLPLLRGLRGEFVEAMEFEMRNPQTGAIDTLEATVRPLIDRGGEPLGALGVFRHVTQERKARETLAQKNRDLETLLHVTSHDLREPLRGIEGFANLLRKRYHDKLDEKGQDFLARIINAVDRLDTLINDVLTLSRAQRLVEPNTQVDLNEVVDDVLTRLGPRIERTGASVAVDDALPSVRADRVWITQAVYNLVVNALKYTVEGEPAEVEIAPFRSRDDGEAAGIVVKDRGPGVEPGQEERIFELFKRGVGRHIEGTGAGLTIVREIAQRHGGRTFVRPREGGGAAFYLTFPLAKSSTEDERDRQ